jgi:hypothetical protein
VHIRGLKGPENLAQALAWLYISNGSTLTRRYEVTPYEGGHRQKS